MKSYKALTLSILIFLIPVIIGGQVNAQSIIKQTETHNVFKGLFLSVWSKLKSLNPHSRQSGKSTVVYTAGIRGAESTDTLIQPYWKGDLSQDKKFQAELKQFTSAQQLMDNGELNDAVKAFDGFINQHASSDLLPNALFSKGICLAGLGKNEQASATINQFVEANPGHPLVEDAKQLLNAI